MKLRNVLDLHDAHQSVSSLKPSLGDGYLVQNNWIYQNVRQAYLSAGGSFTTEDFCNYVVLPYAALPKIIAARKIPYFDNVSVLKEIEIQRPLHFYASDLVRIHPNHTLHESSHCLADIWLALTLTEKHSKKLSHMSADQMKAFRLMMAESFANAIESFGNLPNSTPESRYFYELNSYVTHSKKIQDLLRECSQDYGNWFTFQVLYISYLYSNCLQSEVGTKTVVKIAQAVNKSSKLPTSESKPASLLKLFNHAFDLSLEFRTQTADFYCRLMGIKSTIPQVLHVDILEILEQTTLIQDFLSKAEPLFEN